MTAKRRVLLVSIVPPRNDCGVRIVMYRHFIDRSPFELHVASNADFAEGLVIHTQLRLPYLVHRLRKSRFGPRFGAWIIDYENFIWPLTTNDALEEAVEKFQPEVILTLAESGLCHIDRTDRSDDRLGTHRRWAECRLAKASPGARARKWHLSRLQTTGRSC